MKFTTVVFVALGLSADVWAAPEETAAKVEAVKTVEGAKTVETKPAVTADPPKVEKVEVKAEVKTEKKKEGAGGKVVKEKKIVKIEESAATTAAPPKEEKKGIVSRVITKFVDTAKAVGNKIKGIFGFGKKDEKKEEPKIAYNGTSTFKAEYNDLNKATEVPKKVVVEEKKVVGEKKKVEEEKKNNEAVRVE